VAAALLLCGACASAERYRFRHFGLDDGLNAAVSQVLQDGEGFVWVGTANGLYRFDGAHFRRYGIDDGLPSDSIRSLHRSRDGALWVLTSRGLARRRLDRFMAMAIAGVPATADWHSVNSSANGQMYVSVDRGLLIGDVPRDANPPRFLPAPGAPSGPVYGIYVGSDGTLWFGCRFELCSLNDGRLRRFGAGDGLPRERWSAILVDGHGDLWVRGPQHLLVRPAGASRFQSRDEGLPQSSNNLMTLILDREGTIMASTDGGVARRVDGRWQLIGAAQGLESDAVTTLYEDREGSLWIGMWGGGLARWPNPRQWTNWTAADGLGNNLVWAVRRHPSGALLVGTDRGLVRLDPDGRPDRIWTTANGLGGDKVKALEVGPDGAIWAGCLPGGVSRIDPRTGRVRTYGRLSGLSDDRVIALYRDGEGRLWASAGEGLYRSNGLGPGLRFERQSPPGAQEHTMFFRFLGDRLGRVWVGSSDGLFCWDRGAWRRFTTANGLRSNAVTHVAQTDDGALWIGYREQLGLSRLTLGSAGVQAQHFTAKDGLPSDYILFLGLDSGRRLWVGTDDGVAVQSQSQWVVYTHEDGLVSDDCAANGFWPEPDGTVWIGTLKGLSRFQPAGHPPGAERSAPAPPVAITAARLGGRGVAPSALSEVPYRDRNFSVSFAGLSFVSEKRIRFRYRLVGLDDAWTETDERTVGYSSLPAGAYRFQVIARDANGPWSAPPAEIAFRIATPWWQTWWFRGLVAAALFRLASLLYRARMAAIAGEHRRLETAVRERTRELQVQKDLVERHKGEIEDLLRQSQEVSRLKSEFLANMSHEIRTPMNGVMGMIQLLLYASLDAEQRDSILTMRDSTDALLVVINDILDFSKFEAGKMELVSEPFSIRKCVTDALQVFQWRADEKGLRLVSRVDGGVSPALVGDADRLRQILLNLVSNALKFTDHGEISVAVSLAGESEAAGGPAQTVHIAVRDTGIGIPAEKQRMIFEAFAQVDGSTRRRRGGTGLGLAICAKLAGLMGGQIAVESALGRGSSFSFTVTLPVATGDAAPGDAGECLRPPEGLEATGPAARPLRVLLVEDNLINQKVAKKLVEKLGHAVAVAHDGREAVETAARTSFDLIFMDLQMPEMDGFEATQAIRAAERQAAAGGPTAHVPIVAMTAHAMSGDRELCLAAGMNGYVAKPITMEALAAAIERAAGCAAVQP